MLKDIEFKKIEDVGLAIAPEETDGTMGWVAYLVNFGESKKENILVNSSGYGEINNKPFKTSVLRWFIGDLDNIHLVKLKNYNPISFH